MRFFIENIFFSFSIIFMCVFFTESFSYFDVLYGKIKFLVNVHIFTMLNHSHDQFECSQLLTHRYIKFEENMEKFVQKQFIFQQILISNVFPHSTKTIRNTSIQHGLLSNGSWRCRTAGPASHTISLSMRLIPNWINSFRKINRKFSPTLLRVQWETV